MPQLRVCQKSPPAIEDRPLSGLARQISQPVYVSASLRLRLDLAAAYNHPNPSFDRSRDAGAQGRRDTAKMATQKL